MNKVNKLTIRNYSDFFSGWIENLGVVPLFLLAAFLLAPALTFLLALLFLVTFVRETIDLLQPGGQCPINRKFERKLLSNLSTTVKAFLLGLTLSSGFASEGKIIVLAPGEHWSHQFKLPFRYLLGNKKIIAHKTLAIGAKKVKFILQAKSIGHSELAIMSTNANKKQIFSIFILPKKRVLKLKVLQERLDRANIRYKVKGPLVEVVGPIKTTKALQVLRESRKSSYFRSFLTINADLAPKLQGKIIGSIYADFFNAHIDSINCEIHQVDISCRYFYESRPMAKLEKYFYKKWGAKIIGLPHSGKGNNFIAKLKIIQLENSTGKEIGLGIDRLSTSLTEFFSSPLSSIIAKNQMLLGQEKVQLSTLAEPEIMMQTNRLAKVLVGQKMAFFKSTKEKRELQWKFVGLKIRLKLVPWQNHFRLEYSTELGNPMQGQFSFSSSKESSSLFVQANRTYKLFEIGVKNKSLNKRQLPVLGDIPFLGTLFSFKGTGEQYKRIICLMEIQSTEGD